MRRAYVIISIAFFVFANQGTVSAATLPDFIATGLEGLRSVKILVESLNNDAATIGITKQMLSDKVLVALKSKAPALRYDTEALPYLYVNVTALAQAPYRFAAFVSLQVVRPVEVLIGQDHLNQTPAKRVWTPGATLWDHGSIIVGPLGTASDQVGSALDQLLESFFADWYRSNP